VFGIAIGGAFKEIKGSLSDLPQEAAREPAVAPAPVPGSVPARETDELAARRARRRAS
jgi:hypothetical protein